MKAIIILEGDDENLQRIIQNMNWFAMQNLKRDIEIKIELL